MHLSSTLAALVLGASSFPGILAAPSNFMGSNLYYAAGLKSDEQTTLLQGLQSAGVKVLRVWLDGQQGDKKGTSINDFGSLEGGSPQSWDDTVLNRLDDFMVNAHDYGIKLLVSIHSFNALQYKSDYYSNYDDFYTNEEAIGNFQKRIAHVLEHVNPHNQKSWAESSEYIFAFEAQNEAMHDQEDPDALQSWQCTMAGAIKDNLKGNDGILVTTGGGAWLANSLLDSYFTCDALDVLAIHAYGVGDFETDKLLPYVSKAQDAGKKLIMQEWGACYTDAENNNCNGGNALDEGSRDENIKKWTASIAAAGIAPFYWQILPNEDPHQDWDYEVGIGGVNWDALQGSSAAVNETEGAFDFSKWLL